MAKKKKDEDREERITDEIIVDAYDSEEQAKILQNKPEEKIRMKWLEDEDEKSYFEFRIQVDEITKDVSLMVTDFAEEDEIEEAKMFWENQISELKHTIGV